MEKKYKIGEIFKHGQDWLIVEKNNLCKGCYFDKKGDCEMEEDTLCISSDRENSAPIIFAKISEIEALILKGSDSSED
ncbi:MAG: hypothetical protein ACLT40_00780 [Fusobacterium sp.]